jgi:hypothetical protein
MKINKDKLILNKSSSTENFKNINISSIKSLDKELNSLLKDYIINDDKIFECAIISKNIEKFKGSNLKEIEKAILKEISSNQDIENFIKNEFVANIDNVFIPEYEDYYKKLSIMISNHNSNVKIPKISEYHSEKEVLLNWHEYNTPKVENPRTNPLVGTFLHSGWTWPNVFYKEWIISSYYLLYEYNIWNKVRLYLENIHLNDSKYNSIEYKKAYYYYIARQFTISIPEFATDCYIKNFLNNEVLSRELYEDSLYILLHLKLSNKVIGNKVLESLLNINDKDKFFSVLTNIIKDHYDENLEGYKCLNNLRWFTLNNYLSSKQIEIISKRVREGLI